MKVLEDAIAFLPPTPARDANKAASSTPHILCSPAAQSFIDAYMSEGEIGGVPLEKREPALIVLNHFLLHPFTPGLRRPVPCSLGTRGTGKTVLQAFNLLWFVQRKGGLAIEVTFNDDQGGGMWKCAGLISNSSNLHAAIALRILHRVLSKKLNSIGRATWIIDVQTQLLKLLSENCDQQPIEAALHVARHWAELSPTAPVLLAVDELIKAAPADGAFSTSAMMTNLGSLLEMDCFRTSPLYLAVTIYASTDLATFATDSNRSLLLQPLPPLLPAMPTGLTPEQVKALPLALRVLVDETIRVILPSIEEAVPRRVFGRVSQLLQATGGHPRRLCALFGQLQTFQPSTPLPTVGAPGKGWGQKFVEDLNAWLENVTMGYRCCLASMRSIEAFNCDDTVDLDGLVAATAKRFTFPLDRTVAEHCRPFLNASRCGMCQFIAPRVGLNCDDEQGLDSLQGFAYIPLPVLQKIKELHSATGANSPSLNALNKLTEALTAFGDDALVAAPELRGKPFEDLVEAALVLFLHHNTKFELSQLCGGSTPLLSTLVCGGATTVHRTDIDYFPFHPQPATSPGDQGQPWDVVYAEQLFATLSAPLIFRPSHRRNVSGDIFCLLPFADKVGALLVVIQCRALFNRQNRPTPLQKWRSGRRFFTDATLAYTPSNEVRPNPIPALLTANNITPVFLLFSTNPVDTASAGLLPDEGVVDLVQMRTWQPTTAFAAECATALRAVLRTTPENTDEDDMEQ